MEPVTELASDLDVAIAAAAAVSGGPLETGRGLIVGADQETHERVVRLVAPHLIEK